MTARRTALALLSAVALCVGCREEREAAPGGAAAPGGSPPGRTAAPGASPAAPGAQPSPPPGAGAPVPPGTSRELLARVEAVREELEKRPKTLEIELALGNLYFDNGRFTEAITWYARAVERASAAEKRWTALPRAVRARAERAAGELRAGGGSGPCVPSRDRGFAELLAAAEERLRPRATDEGATCLAAALEPAVAARERRANAYFFVGDQDEAVAEHEALLAAHPGHHESWLHLGFMLAETAGEDPARLRRARGAWERYLREAPASPRAPWVQEQLRELDARITRSATPGGAAPPARTPSSR